MFVFSVLKTPKTLALLLSVVCIINPAATLAMAQDDESGKPTVVALLLEGNIQKSEATALNLEEALRIALEENQTRLAAQDEVKRAKARYYTRLIEFLPELTLTRPFVHYTGSVQTTTGTFLEVERRNFQPQMVFRFTLLQQGSQVLQAMLSKKELAAQREKEEAVIQDILRKTASAYYTLQHRLSEVAIARQQLDETMTNFEFTKSCSQSGGCTPLAALQSEGQLMDAQQQYIEAVQNSETAALRLNEILNLPAFAEMVPPEGGQPMQALVGEDLSFELLMAEANRNNPRLKAMTKQIESLTQFFKPAAIAVALLPEVYVQHRKGKTGMTLDHTAPYEETSYGVGWTLNDMGLNSSFRYREMKAQIKGLRHQLEAERNTIEQELGEAWLAAKASHTQVGVARKKLQVFEDTRKEALNQLKAGGQNMDVVNAQGNLNLARRQLNTTILEYNQAHIEIVYAMGLASVDTLSRGVPIL